MAAQEKLMTRLDTRDDSFADRFATLEARRQTGATEIEGAAREIVEDVRVRGDAALLDAVERFDGYRLAPEDIIVSAEEIEKGAASLDAEDRDALKIAAERIRAYHATSVPEGWSREGVDERLGQRVRPLERVGLYVPAGQAPLASTVLMLGIPARVAGVAELVVASPGREIHPAILEAARLVGVERLVRVGGAQGIAALAYGTDHVPRVDKIVGPGNAYVQAAKRLVFGEVAIDAEAGPSEVLIIADESAPAEWIAADLLAQAEHDPMASVVLTTPSSDLVDRVEAALVEQLADLPTHEVARQALAGRSALVVTRDIDEAVMLANRYGAEHLQLMLQDAERWIERIENAGAIFLGSYSPVPIGDYVAGPSHVLPTGGTSRFFSVVGVEDFQKRMSVIDLGPGAFREIGGTAVRLAKLEDLHAHARSLSIRRDPPD